VIFVRWSRNFCRFAMFAGSLCTHVRGNFSKSASFEREKEGFSMILNRRDYAAVRSFFHNFSNKEEK